MPQRDAACGEARSKRNQQRARGQALGSSAFEHEEHGGGRHVAVIGEDFALMIESALVERQRQLECGNDFRAAGMTNEAIDVVPLTIPSATEFR